ncbi:MAG: methionine adenosyltransferase [Gemmatimonadota bacterium]
MINSTTSSRESCLFSAESVAAGHPDKLADQISDAIVDAFLQREPRARVACETLVADGYIVLAGEFRTAAEAVFHQVRDGAPRTVRDLLREVGYTDRASGIDVAACEIVVRFNHQSADIAQGVDRTDREQGAGDQGTMFGYATRETDALMPKPIWLAHRLMQRQGELRRHGALPWMRPDGKTQVTVRYRHGVPAEVVTVVLSTQHAPDVSPDRLRDDVIRHIIEPVIPEAERAADIRYLINPTGRFEIGGPLGDTGLTGRKNIVDTYGGSCPHGGGALSGKDPSKVDRSAAYMARYIAKNVVAARLAERCMVQLAYSIGLAEPVSLLVDTHGTGAVSDAVLEATVPAVFPLTPRGIIDALNLLRPIYRATAVYGHFGREEEGFAWERTDRVDSLLRALGR